LILGRIQVWVVMGFVRRTVVGLLFLSLLSFGANQVSAQAGCEQYLFQEHASTEGTNCPDLPGLAATGVVFSNPSGKRGRVREIVDGDTLRISFGDRVERVRIFSVDTPEIYSGSECYGQEATTYTESLIPVGTIVWLEQGIVERDRYDRLLFYVWFEQGAGRYRLLQDAIVRDGYGVVEIYPPDDRYEGWLLQGEQDALNAGRGLWAMCGGADTPLSPPTPTPAPVSSQAQGIAANTGCDPSYPGVCISPVSQAGDLDCGDILYRRFTVLQPDPHNFDGDHDGIGCESG
jgi:micrococcal nuclease